MNIKPRYFGLLIVLAMAATIRICNASTNGGPDLYADSLYLEKSSGEVPQAFESSAREKPVAVAKTNIVSEESVAVAEAPAPRHTGPMTAADLPPVESFTNVAPAKKLSAHGKKVAKRKTADTSVE